jgi:PAS domain S-box-containing protein
MHVARTGESEVYSRLTDSLLGDIAWNDEHGNILISLDVQSAALIPLVARGRTLGVMTLATTSRGRMYTDSDLPFIEELARRCALAVDNARLYRDAQREIAERNRITEGLRESENRYRAVVSTVMDGIVTIDAAGTIIFANPAVERLFGYAPSDLIGQNVKILMPAPDALRHDTYLARYLETGHAKIIGIGREVTAKRNDGSTFPINLSIGEFSQDGHRFFTGVIQDITQRKRAEENLKALNETLERRVEQRSGFVKLLRDVAVIANEAPTADEAFRLVLECVCAYNGWLVGHVFAVGECDNPVIVDSGIWAPGPPRRLNRLVARSRDTTLQSGEDIVGRVVESGKPVWIAELSKCDLLVRARLGKSTFIKSLIAVPVWVGSRVAAVLEFFSADEVSVDEELFEVMRQIGVQVGRVVERKQWVKQVADAVWEEHAKVGQTLHDDLGQHMTGIGLLAESIHRTLRAENSPAKKTAADLVKSAREARQQISALIKGIRPVEVDAEGLMVALKELSASTVRLSGIRCTFKCNGTVRVENNKVATHLFQIAREAVTNAVRHAKANRIAVQLSISRGRLILRVRDNGVGICERAHGMGLRIMQHRAGLIGAELDVGTGRQGGTVIVCTLKPNGNHVR